MKTSFSNNSMALAISLAVLMSLAAGCASAPRGTGPASVEKELIKLENGWSDAYIKADVAFLDRNDADDWTITGSDGSFSTKAEEIAELKSGNFKTTSFVQAERKVRVYGNAAVVTGRLTLKAQYKGTDASGEFRFTDTWVKRSGRWQCVATHLSKIAEQK